MVLPVYYFKCIRRPVYCYLHTLVKRNWNYAQITSQPPAINAIEIGYLKYLRLSFSRKIRVPDQYQILCV
jgi:hypothetical protein